MKISIILIVAAVLILHGCKPNENKENLTEKNILSHSKDSNEVIKKENPSIVDTQKNSPAKEIHYYKPNYTILHGKLTKELVYGPPGYGKDPQNDKQEYLYFLTLSKPINITTHPRSGKPVYDDKENILKIQVFSNSADNNTILESSVNNDILMKGMLIGNSGDHKTSEVSFEVIAVH